MMTEKIVAHEIRHGNVMEPGNQNECLDPCTHGVKALTPIPLRYDRPRGGRGFLLKPLRGGMIVG